MTRARCQTTDTMLVVGADATPMTTESQEPMTERFAIYYAPQPGSALDRRAQIWLGLDESQTSPVVELLGASGLDAMKSARRYGFHATLKPPMRLAAGRDASAFVDAATAFATDTSPVNIGQLVVKNLDGFLALIPAEQSTELAMFAASCVSHFEPFRAPLNEAEISKRLAHPLSARQHELLEQYGYPYVMDEFRMHLTLTDRLDVDIADRLQACAKDWFAPDLNETHILDHISIFTEQTSQAGFSRLADFPLSGTSNAKAS